MQTNQIQQVFSVLRSQSGGKLTQAQVDAGDAIIATMGIDALSKLLGIPVVTNNVVNISAAGIALLKEFEGLKTTAYQDTGKVWTIGYGTIKYPSGAKVAKGDKITEAQASEYLLHDVQWAVSCVDKAVTKDLNQNQFDALVCFVYNVGESAFKSSTMLRLLNEGKYSDAANQFDRWVNDNGKKIQGLVTRRAKEKALFNKE